MPMFCDGTWQEIRLDIDQAVQPDVVGTITDMSTVADASVDAVFSSHNVEHIYPHEIPGAFGEFHRVLDPGGIAVITCPDLQAIGTLLAEGKLTTPAYHSGMGPIAPLDIIYGHNGSIAEGNTFMAHRCGFDAISMSKALKAAGFSTVAVKRMPKDYALWAFAWRSTQPADIARRFVNSALSHIT